MKEKQFFKKNKWLLIVLPILLFVIYSIYCTYHIRISNYHIELESENAIRVVQLTDLHSKEFGKENRNLISIIKKQKPDLIFLTGDMIADDSSSITDYLSFVTKLTQIAPVYSSLGNDENSWAKNNNTDIKTLISEAGAKVLDNTYADLEINNIKIRIGGYYGYYGCPHMKNISKAEQEEEMVFFRRFEDTDRYKILLCHIPTEWLDWNYIDKYPVDLIFSGHYHGGIIRFPNGVGLYAPYVGWFPKFTRGMFKGSQGVCVLSSGFATKNHIPRLNNCPEIVVVDIGNCK